MDENTKKIIEETVDEAVKTAMETQTAQQAQKTKKKKAGGMLGYMFGSLVLMAGASVAVPRIMTALSHKAYKEEKPVIDEDYEPEIVKREKKEEE